MIIANRTSWSPNHLKPELWLEADQFLGRFADGATIAAADILDGAGFMQPWRPSAPAVGPIYRKSVALLNNRPGFELGTNGGLLVTDFITNPFTMLIVETGQSVGFLSRTVAGLDTNLLMTLGFRPDNIAAYNFGVMSNTVTNAPGLSVMSVGAESRYYVNGFDVTTDTTLLHDFGWIVMGMPNQFSEPGRTTCAVVMTFRRVLSAAERLQLVRYYGVKYGFATA